MRRLWKYMEGRKRFAALMLLVGWQRGCADRRLAARPERDRQGHHRPATSTT